ncbi:hypothetical protein B0H16DRAFT_1571673 [Mycena metata]|uniref:Uncharacterized protein n=1 Tax=Mycena metata TaxID=1033252 RepID=A0AAD7I9G1_9AGAR|nr:hypothetical protein B0H16DRAFT_1571673 [Mycena metata]
MLSPYRATLVSTWTSGIQRTTSSSMVPRMTRTTSSPSMRRVGRSTTTSRSHLFLRSWRLHRRWRPTTSWSWTSRWMLLPSSHIRAGTLVLARHSFDSLCCPLLLVLRRTRATPTCTPTRGLRGSRRSRIRPHHRSKQNPKPPRLQPSAPAGPPPPSPPSHLSARLTLPRRPGRSGSRGGISRARRRLLHRLRRPRLRRRRTGSPGPWAPHPPPSLLHPLPPHPSPRPRSPRPRASEARKDLDSQPPTSGASSRPRCSCRRACRWGMPSASTLRCLPSSTRQAVTRGSAPVQARRRSWLVRRRTCSRRGHRPRRFCRLHPHAGGRRTPPLRRTHPRRAPRAGRTPLRRVIMTRTTRTTWGRGSRSQWRCSCVVDRALSLPLPLRA